MDRPGVKRQQGQDSRKNTARNRKNRTVQSGLLERQTGQNRLKHLGQDSEDKVAKTEEP